jgi:hypothetical protein
MTAVTARAPRPPAPPPAGTRRAGLQPADVGRPADLDGAGAQIMRWVGVLALRPFGPPLAARAARYWARWRSPDHPCPPARATSSHRRRRSLAPWWEVASLGTSDNAH